MSIEVNISSILIHLLLIHDYAAYEKKNTFQIDVFVWISIKSEIAVAMCSKSILLYILDILNEVYNFHNDVDDTAKEFN